MIHFTVTVYGQKAVANELRTAAAKAQPRIRNATYDWAMSRVMSQLAVKEYPAKRPGQRYVRTGKLRSGWVATPLEKGVKISNKMSYAGYVVGDAKGQRQAWMHPGRWWKAADIINNERPRLKKGIEHELAHLFTVHRRIW